MKKLITVALMFILVPMLFGTDRVSLPKQLCENPEFDNTVLYRPAARGTTVLFVQDGAGYGPGGVDPYWNGPLENLLGTGNYGWFGPTTGGGQNGPSLTVMQNYDLVIWNNYDHWDAATLTSTDRTNINSYLTGGGQVWLIGQDARFSGVPLSFFQTNFDVSSIAEDYATLSSLTFQGIAEVAGDPFSVTSDLLNSFYPDDITPNASAHDIVLHPGYNKNPGILRNDSSSSFWTVDGRMPNPELTWETLVEDMLKVFGIELAAFAHDVGVNTVDIPGALPNNSTRTPQATVRNFADNTETFDVTCEINPGAYTSTASVTDLLPDSTTQVTFPDIFDFVSGTYTVTTYTQLVGDENPPNDTATGVIQVSDWLHYDDGVAAQGWAFYYADNGFGVQFPVPQTSRMVDYWVDSIAVIFSNAAGGNTATFWLYDGATEPTTMRWSVTAATIVEGSWNYFEIDTALTHFTSGDNIFVFYIQVNDDPYAPFLAIDAAKDGPLAMQWNYLGSGGSFGHDDRDGDWLMRAHVISADDAVGEWISPAPSYSLMLNAPTIITKGKTKIQFTVPAATNVDLCIYDVIGRVSSTLVSERLFAGVHNVDVSIDLPAGVYFYKLRTESDVITKKFLVVE